MRILVLTNYFPPEIGAASHLFYDLSVGLVQLGHQVTVVTGFPRYNVTDVPSKYKGKFYLREQMDGVGVLRVPIPPFPKRIPVLRGLEHLVTGAALGLGGILAGRHDIILVYSPPLTIGLSAYLVGMLRKVPFVFNVQDVFPKYAVDAGILKSRTLIRFFEWMEKFIYRRARYVTVHSDGNKKYLLSKQVPSDKAVVILNWVDTDFITPGDKQNEFYRENKLDGKFIVSFAGTMGFVQDMGTIVEAARILLPHKDVLFLLVGDGVQKEDVEQQAERLQLTNMKFVPMQPWSKYPLVLHASDVSLVTLRKEVTTPVVPSKLLSIMASGRPVVASLPLDGDAPKIVEAAKCGYCVEAGNAEAMAQAILRIHDDPSLAKELGNNGRRYAERHFARRVCVKQYETLFRNAVEEKGAFATTSRQEAGPTQRTTKPL